MNERIKGDSRDCRKTVYISSRISKCIESMIEDKNIGNMVYQSRYGVNWSNINVRMSMEDSPDLTLYKRTNASQGRPSFLDNSEFKSKRK